MKHKIYTRNDQKKEPLTPAARALVKRAITAALDYEQFEGAAEVSVTFVDNEAIRELNRDYRGKDAATDVLSFPLFEDDEDFDDGFVLPPDMEEDEE
ncbi:MAG: rRNA maturation RNase YbeY, partial [Clostridia bacterium]|nr:rRNA maturation RNase YbeY [Clostridia bacterium]